MSLNKFKYWFLVFPVVFCCSEEAMSSGSKEIDLGLSRSQAVLHAVKRFQEDGYRWESYRMIISEGRKALRLFLCHQELQVMTHGLKSHQYFPRFITT